MKTSQVTTYVSLTLASTLLCTTAAQAATITAVANSNPAVSNACGITQLIDGDFKIHANTGNPPVDCFGDGVDETIDWNFDFLNDPDLVDFLASAILKGKLQSAIATFTVTPKSGLITTDSTGIPGVIGWAIPSLPGVPGVNQTGTFSIDLLAQGATDDHIITALASGEAGKIPWRWQDDVVMHSATLELHIPEPATALGLLCFGVLAPIVQRSKTKKL
jgi:hypothetical protein